MVVSLIIYHGYTGRAADYLISKGIKPGDYVIVKLVEGVVFRGILLPRPEIYASSSLIVVKLENGYNVGLDLAKIESIEKTTIEGKASQVEVSRITQNPMLPRVTLISTGGTIASKVDYSTGAVTPALKPEDIIEWIPELGEVAFVNAREVMSIFSEDMTPQHWEKIALEVYREIDSGAQGVVIAHGTDTMSYTASAMAFSIFNKPVPIVLVGAQRSSDRPSTDAVFNLISAFLVAAKAPFAESVVVMHSNTSDELNSVHRGVKVRKMHTSRRDAFQSINDKPIALVNPITREIKVVGKIIEYRGEKKPELRAKFDEKVALIKAYPGLQQEIIDFLVDKGFHGIVVEGTGLGHIANRLIESIKRAVENNIPVVMTSQCLFGRVNMNVYSTGRRLIEAGVIPGHDILPETAYVKLSWILGSITRDLGEVRKWFELNLVGEFNDRHVLGLYPRWNNE
jgi:glutamyl-tRNA(Gln) amidotransferase subunit D